MQKIAHAKMQQQNKQANPKPAIPQNNLTIQLWFFGQVKCMCLPEVVGVTSTNQTTSNPIKNHCHQTISHALIILFRWLTYLDRFDSEFKINIHFHKLTYEKIVTKAIHQSFQSFFKAKKISKTAQWRWKRLPDPISLKFSPYQKSILCCMACRCRAKCN